MMAFNTNRDNSLNIPAGQPYQDLIEVALEQAADVGNIGNIRAGLAESSSFERSYQMLVVAAAYARRGCAVRCLPNQLRGTRRASELRVSVAGATVPVVIAGPGAQPLPEEPANKYRALGAQLRSAAGQLPEGRGGVVHLFVPAEQASELAISPGQDYHYFQHHLLVQLPGVSALVIESLQPCPWTGRTLHRRHLLANPGAASALPAKLNLGLAHTELPEWHPLEAVFPIEYDYMLPEYPETSGGGAVEVEWLSSPHGSVQVRMFLLPGGYCRTDLRVAGHGRALFTGHRGGLSSSVAHHVRLDLHGGIRQVDVRGNGWLVDESNYSLAFYPE